MTQPVYPYSDILMRGNTSVRRIIEAHLKKVMPNLIDVARIQWGVDEKRLPYPKHYSANDPTQALEYPFCGSYLTGTDDFVRTGTNPSGSISYDAAYETTLFVATETAQLGSDGTGPLWEKDERESALRQRDDLVAIMRAAILNTPSLGTVNNPRYRAYAREETMRESYPEPVKVSDGRNPRWICSGVITVTIRLSESTVVPLVGEVKQTQTEVQALPPTHVIVIGGL